MIISSVPYCRFMGRVRTRVCIEQSATIFLATFRCMGLMQGPYDASPSLLDSKSLELGETTFSLVTLGSRRDGRGN
ncbi:hypothetical protein B296_00001655 [Ensete ventricosum]|uniref:Uncharacterized protein n=1 Tax=Ensete ventricosum TaxID=4639 RepID=A0A427AQ74_ENSVE|nr:hypothetical protein B296_00001655 [Ensete ventricosum]